MWQCYTTNYFTESIFGRSSEVRRRKLNPNVLPFGGYYPVPKLLQRFFGNFDNSTTDFQPMMGPFYPVDRQTDELLKELKAYTHAKAR